MNSVSCNKNVENTSHVSVKMWRGGVLINTAQKFHDVMKVPMNFLWKTSNKDIVSNFSLYVS